MSKFSTKLYMFMTDAKSKALTGTRKFLRNEDGPTMVEYGLLVALIALVVAIAAALLGTGISALFSRADGSLA